MSDPILNIAIDGSCRPNPGRGAWGCVVQVGSTHYRALCGVSPRQQASTNQRMEIVAAIMALRSVNPSSTIAVISDSKYLTSTMTGEFQRKKNQDLWALLDDAVRPHASLKDSVIAWLWVPRTDPFIQSAHDLTDWAQANPSAVGGRWEGETTIRGFHPAFLDHSDIIQERLRSWATQDLLQSRK